MVKKAKKKTRGGTKEKRNPVASPNPIDQQDAQEVNAPEEDGVTAVNDKKICPHIDKGIDVEKVSSKLGSSGPVRCEDCREGAVNRRAGKGKGKHGKKKGGGESKSASKAIWVCLECGHYSCGGAGFPTIPQSHAVRHARQYHHQLAVQFENPQLCWCFPCNRLIPTEQKDILHDIVKMIKGRPSEGPGVDVEDVWFGTGSITNEIKSEASGYVVRGLFNLGNTCFFNSVIQNLLAMNRLRDYFLERDECDGPLAAAFKKLFAETSIGDASRNTVNPKSFFGSLCAKASQFRGYQQHDSHELLHSLLDGLSTEELTARNKLKSSQDDGKSPTYVDAIFGGRLSSTVTCLECAHSSLVYEPFLDLSLPVPTKKTPSKKAQPVSRLKKSKHPPKRSGRVRPKISRDAASLSSQSAQEISSKTEVPSDSALLDSLDASSVADNMGLTSHNLYSSLKSNYEENVNDVTGKVTSVDSSTWLDYLDQDIMPNGNDMASEITSPDPCSSQKSNINEQNDNGVTGQQVTSVDSSTWLDYLDQDIMPNGNDMASEITSPDPCSSQKSNINEQNDNGVTGQQVTSDDSSTWLDYLDQDIMPNGNDMASETTSPDPCSSQKSNINEQNGNGVTGQSTTSMDNTCSEYLDQDIMPKGDDVTSKVDIPSNQGCATENVVQPNVSLQNDLNAHSDSKLTCEEGAAKDLDAREVEHNAASGSQVLSVDSNLDSSTRLGEVEAPLQLQDSEILLLPYKEETSTTCDVLKGEGEDFLDFDGFGGLFNEPEPVAGPAEKPLPNGFGEASSAVGNSTESDPDEVDNTDTPVSVESCLACFTKPELLSKTEHAWQCENCAKLLREQRMRSEGGVHSSQDEDSSLENCDNQNNGVQLDERSANYESGESENETDSKGVKVERDATKRMLIDKAPPILTIHLKRFSQDARGRLSKLSGHVNFRDTIDITTIVDPRCLQKEVYKYRLVGVVEHSGTMRGGHYVAYVRGGPKIAGKDKDAENYVWYYASDAYVREVPLEEVLRSEAYILFYEEI